MQLCSCIKKAGKNVQVTSFSGIVQQYCVYNFNDPLHINFSSSSCNVLFHPQGWYFGLNAPTSLEIPV